VFGRSDGRASGGETIGRADYKTVLFAARLGVTVALGCHG
jgi:hypothetical protein